MKRILFSVVGLLSLTAMAQQSFSGFTGGYYSGTHRVLSNPASIAGSPRKWDVNLLSVSANLGTDAMELELGKLEKSFNKFTELGNLNNFSGKVNVDVLGPSFSFTLNDKHAVAITTRARVFADINDFDAKFVQTLINDVKDINGLPYVLSVQNQSITANAFSEIGATWAGTVFQSASHTIKAGVTAKYLRGTANTNLYINNLNGVLFEDAAGKDVYLTANGELNINNAGVSILNFEADDLLKSNASGFGGDLGIVYEYRENPDDKKYRLKAGVAVTDIGSLKYKSIKGESFSYALNAATVKVSDDMEENLRNNPNVIATESGDESYNVSLPTAMRSQIDYRIVNNLYVELAGVYGISKDSKKTYIPYYANEVTLTPRYETKYYGLYVPLNYNELTKYNAGLALRLGPIFVGSNTLLSGLSKGKQLDVFFGIRFGG